MKLNEKNLQDTNSFLNKVQILKRNPSMQLHERASFEKPGNFTFQDLVDSRRPLSSNKSILD